MALLQVAEAQQLVLQHSHRLPAETVALSPSVLGRILAEDIASDIDSPPLISRWLMVMPFDPAISNGKSDLIVVEEILAGTISRRMIQTGEAASIMTGAAIPHGCDAVVMHEVTTFDEQSKRVQIPGPVKPRQNIMAQANEMKQGEVVLPTGTMLRPKNWDCLPPSEEHRLLSIALQEWQSFLLAMKSSNLARPLGRGHIRNSNASMLMALVTRAKAQPNYLGIAHDTLESLRPLIARGLKADVLPHHRRCFGRQSRSSSRYSG